jgi:Skp family chaperone for outer membrane proteins
MNRFLLSVTLLVSGCAISESQGEHSIAHTIPASKQRLRIAHLQKKLEFAQRNLQKAQEEVEEINSQLHQSQLALIEKQIQSYESKVKKHKPTSNFEEERDDMQLFLREREMLQEMMETGPSPESFEAQLTLDRILRMITESRDTDAG